MGNEHYINFLDSSEESIKEKKKEKLSFNIAGGDMNQFLDIKSAAERMNSALLHSLENLDDELNKFENLFTNKYNSVFWASDFNDVFENLKKIIKSNKIKSVRLPNVNASTIFRELGIKYFLGEQKVSLEENGDMQFFVADLMLSDTGNLLLLNQTNHSIDRLTNNKINVFFTTIDRIVGNTALAEIYQQMATYATGGANQEMVLFKGSPNCSNYLFIIDNQRTALLHEKKLRQALTCLQCGRCSEVCPVAKTIGDEPYNNVFSGPIANITLPFLETFETYRHVAYACTLCGRCEEVCPISLPLRNMIIEERQIFFAEEMDEKEQHRTLIKLHKFLSSRKRMNMHSLRKNMGMCSNLSADIKKSRKLPSFSNETFNKEFLKQKKNK